MKAIIFDKKPNNYVYLIIPELNNLAIHIAMGRIMAWGNVDLSGINTMNDKKQIEIPEDLGMLAESLAKAQKGVYDRLPEFLQFL